MMMFLCLQLAISSTVLVYSSTTDSIFRTKLDEHNKLAYYSVLDYSSTTSSSSQWTFVNEKDGVTVHKKFLQDSPVYLHLSDVAAGKKHAIVKSSGIVNASPKDVFALFLNNNRVKEYNEHCEVLNDVEIFPKTTNDYWSKVSWAASPKYGVFKARAFCSVVAYFQHSNNGTYYIVNRPAYLGVCPPDNNNKYVRATVLLAGNILEPYGPNGNMTKFTQIAHINPGGGADTTAIAWVINKLCAVGPPTFIRKLETAAQSTIKGANSFDLRSISTAIENAIPKFPQLTQGLKKIQLEHRHSRETRFLLHLKSFY